MGIVDDTLGSNIFGNNSTDRAIGAQTGATREANDALRSSYDTSRDALRDSYNDQYGMIDPYRQAGFTALGNLTTGRMSDTLKNDPGYQFRLAEGQKALERSAAARGNLNSGATLKNLSRFGQDFASNEYQNAYNRALGLANIGFNATSNLMNSSNNYGSNLANLATGYGNAVSGNITGLGNANAAAQIAQANRGAGLLGQGAMAAGMFFSDERLKKKIKAVDEESLKEMKKHLKAYAFNYKNKDHGEGEWVGVMAQDLEKSRLGRSLVVYDRFGNKGIDLKRVLSLFLATMA